MKNFFRPFRISRLICALAMVTVLPARGSLREGGTLNTNIPIRVLLERHLREIVVTSSLNHLYLNAGGRAGWRQIDKSARFSVTKDSRIALNGIPLDGSEAYVRGGPHPVDKLSFSTGTFRGALKLSASKPGGELSVINILPVEEYLVGMLGAEMNPSWEIEALKAQAVASRTYAVYMRNHPKSALYDLEKSTQDQVYRGAGTESTRVLAAIQATRGEVLTRGDTVIKAYFHSRCGGQTETPSSVWNQKATAERAGVPCPYCRQHPYSWSSVFSFEQLAGLLRFRVAPKSAPRLAVLSRTPSGRVRSLRIGEGSRTKVLTADQFRALVGYTKIKSAHFGWRLGNGAVTFEGFGLGHGVGMCQWGARSLARAGKNYRDILAYFYPSAHLSVPSAPRLAASFP